MVNTPVISWNRGLNEGQVDEYIVHLTLKHIKRQDSQLLAYSRLASRWIVKVVQARVKDGMATVEMAHNVEYLAGLARGYCVARKYVPLAAAYAALALKTVKLA